MKKISIALLVLLMSTSVYANLYFCANNDCATWIIEDSSGFSWLVECMDGTVESGRVPGSSYGGGCQLI